MVDRDIVLSKVTTIDRCLERIADVRSRLELRPIDVDDLAQLNLQRAIQAAIDLAAHVVASEHWGAIDRLADSFTALRQQGVIEAALEARLRKMVGFRNIAVHEYQSVDPAIVRAILDKHLGDLRELARAVTTFFSVMA